ncbi:MAG: class I SAM-dependent methyltransferase [Candidatus Thorarchaeota archaeon]|nr:class I SAM-dependent methyltransferase [Candidatus Thorarchaeota archaeon]
MNIWYTILFIEIIVIAFMIWIVWSTAVGAPWLPTSKSKVRKMLEFAKVGDGDIVYDLVSGDGRIIIMAAKDFGAKSVGIEADPVRQRWSMLMVRRHKLRDRVKVLRGNFFNFDIGDASVVTLYLGVGANNKLRNKLSEELKPGSRIVSHHFVLKDWEPVETDEEADLYLYKI